jgi:hypothetical protein
MNYIRTFMQYVVTIIVTVFLYYLISKGANKILLSIVVLLLSAGKTIYFSTKTFRKLIDITQSIKYLNFLAFVAFNIFYLVFSFSLDYFLIFCIDADSFSGMEGAGNIFEIYFKMFYLSFLLFTNMGVANVVPVAIPAECLVMFEAITSFATIIFILSDFVSLKDSLNKFRQSKHS